MFLCPDIVNVTMPKLFESLVNNVKTLPPLATPGTANQTIVVYTDSVCGLSSSGMSHLFTQASTEHTDLLFVTECPPEAADGGLQAWAVLVVDCIFLPVWFLSQTAGPGGDRSLNFTAFTLPTRLFPGQA